MHIDPCGQGVTLVLEIRGDGLDDLQAVAALPRWPEGASHEIRTELAREESTIRDSFAVYGYAFDNRDLDTVMGFFADDCVITNPRGKVAGRAAIRANYQVLFGYWSSTRHLWVNVVVRFPSTTDAYLAAYHYATLVSSERTLAGTGTDLWQLRKTDGVWRIAERWITDDIDHEISLYVGPAEDPDKVDKIRRAVVD